MRNRPPAVLPTQPTAVPGHVWACERTSEWLHAHVRRGRAVDQGVCSCRQACGDRRMTESSAFTPNEGAF